MDGGAASAAGLTSEREGSQNSGSIGALLQSGSEQGGGLRLQLTYRNLHGAAEDGGQDDDEGKAGEVPDAGSRAEARLVWART